MSLKKLLLLCFLSGILLVLSFPPFNLTIFVWVGLVPLLIAIEGLKPKNAFILSYLTGIVFFWGLLHWLIHVTLLGQALLVLYLGLYFGIFGLIVSKCQKNLTKGTSYSLLSTLYPLLWIPSLWVMLEWLRGRAFTGFGWGILGYSQYLFLPIVQIADITGVYGISFLIVMVNVTIYKIIREVRLKNYTWLISPILFASLCLCSTLIYGYIRLAREPTHKRVRIAVVQGNISQQLKWDPEVTHLILAKYSKLTRLAAVDGPDLIIWPETSCPGWLGKEPWLMDQLAGLARKINTPILVGSPFWDSEKTLSFNSAILISRNGKIISRYDKLHLVPFGEYTPRYFNFAARIDERLEGGRFNPGHRYTQFRVAGARFGVLICFEDIFPELARRFVRDGANLMVNITNDAWFGETGAPYQHAQASALRAVENRIPVVRCANTGLSCFIEPNGRIISRVMDEEGRDIFITGFLTRDVSLGERPTIYTRFGDWFVYLCILISIGSGIGFFLTKD